MKQNQTQKEAKQAKQRELIKLLEQVPKNSDLYKILKIKIKYNW